MRCLTRKHTWWLRFKKQTNTFINLKNEFSAFKFFILSVVFDCVLHSSVKAFRLGNLLLPWQPWVIFFLWMLHACTQSSCKHQCYCCHTGTNSLVLWHTIQMQNFPPSCIWETNGTQAFVCLKRTIKDLFNSIFSFRSLVKIACAYRRKTWKGEEIPVEFLFLMQSGTHQCVHRWVTFSWRDGRQGQIVCLGSCPG